MTVVHAMLGNAVVAALLALVALAVGYACRSPVVRHAAWVVVLLKLLTPPLFSVPLPVLPASWETPAADPPAGRIILLAPSGTDGSPSPVGIVASAPVWWNQYWPAGLVGWALLVWVVGSFGWFAWQGRRVLRFRRRVRGAEDAPPEVAEAAGRIAEALGLARLPAVKVATGIGSPMLWGWGRGAVVLFPRELLARLSPEARDTLLAHELAHFLRRDHWVRVLEFLATGLYWWHPAVWIARNGIEAAEEECCDAWVVGGLAASPRRYAEALLATVDFEAELRRPCLPPGACAANRSARLLRRRLFGIVHATGPGRLPGGKVTRALVVAALLTQPVLRAATRDADVGGQPPVEGSHTVLPAPRSPKADVWPRPQPTAREPRAWATAEAPGGGLTVVARDKEIIIRQPDGGTRTLGPGRPLALSFAPGNRRLVTAGPGPLVRAWDDRGNLLVEARTPVAARAVAHTPDGTRLLVLDAAGGVTVRDPQTLAVVATWSVEGPANSIACAADSRTVIVSFGSWLSETGRVELWSVPDRRKLATYYTPMPVGASRLSPDGKTLVVGGWGGQVNWLSLPGGELVAGRELPKDVVATAAFSPDAGTLPLEPPPEPAPPPSLLLPGPEWVQNATQIPGP